MKSYFKGNRRIRTLEPSAENRGPLRQRSLALKACGSDHVRLLLRSQPFHSKENHGGTAVSSNRKVSVKIVIERAERGPSEKGHECGYSESEANGEMQDERDNRRQCWIKKPLSYRPRT